MVNFGDYSSDVFKFWIIIAQIFVFISFAYSLLSPFVESLILRMVSRVLKERAEKAVAMEAHLKEQRKLAKARGKKVGAVAHTETDENMEPAEPQYDD
jgi:hypothetical protein